MSREHSRRVPPHLFDGRCNTLEPSTWRSPDGATSVWYVGNGDFRISTKDHRRAARLRRMTRVELVGDCVVGEFTQLFLVDRRKIRSEALRRLLWGDLDQDTGPNEITRQEAAGSATTTWAGR